eukprot:g17944.t1
MAQVRPLAIGQSAPIVDQVGSDEQSDEISDTEMNTEMKLADRSPDRFSSAVGNLYSVHPSSVFSDSWTLCRCFARANQGVHGFRGLRLWVQEIPIFVGGVAFNPVFIIWTLLLVYLLFDLPIEFEGGRGGEKEAAKYGRAIVRDFWDHADHEHVNFKSINSQAYSLRPLLGGSVVRGRFYRWYILTALMTLLVTEILKFCFRSPRPDYNFYATQCSSPASQHLKRHQYWRRHFKFPNLYKSRYSFPSGDTAQAANFGLFMFVFGGYVSGMYVLLPLVAFARVFYVCHWIEDTIGGCLLGTLTQYFMYLYLVETSAGDRLIYLTRDNWFFRSCLRPAAEAAGAATRVGEKDGNFDFSGVELEKNFLLRKEFGFPSFLCSVIRRVYYLSEDIGPVVSLRDAKKKLENFYQMDQKRTGSRERDSGTCSSSEGEGAGDGVQQRDEVGAEEEFGILAFPRNLENELCEQFNKRHGGAGRRVGVVVFADGLFWLGLGAHVWNFPIPERENLTAPCSAAWKLREVFQRGLLPLCQGSDDVALDVGAAPGGWSWFLAEEQLRSCSSSPGQEDVLELGSSPGAGRNCGSFHSIAVDPAELDPEVRTHQNVTHCQMKAEDFLDAVAVEGCLASSEPSRASSVAVARARTALEKGNGYALYVCDANCEPEKAVELLERSRVVARSERTHGKQTSYFVLTIKIRESATRFAKRKPFLLERLRALSGGKMREVHLFANTKHELTTKSDRGEPSNARGGGSSDESPGPSPGTDVARPDEEPGKSLEKVKQRVSEQKKEKAPSNAKEGGSSDESLDPSAAGTDVAWPDEEPGKTLEKVKKRVSEHQKEEKAEKRKSSGQIAKNKTWNFDLARQWRALSPPGDRTPNRSIVRTKGDDGRQVLLGARLGRQLTIVASQDGGASWYVHGTVATAPEGIEYGDPMLLAVPESSTVLIAFREHDGVLNSWRVTLCRSEDRGKTWEFDSTVAGPFRGSRGVFVGAPAMRLRRADHDHHQVLQVYFDNEPEPERHGLHGHQWITMVERADVFHIKGPEDGKGNHEEPPKNFTIPLATYLAIFLVLPSGPDPVIFQKGGRWGDLVVVSRAPDRNEVSRDGMATVIDLDGQQVMCVTEGVQGGANVVRAVFSGDGGRTWDWRHSRQIVYAAGVDPISGKRYNAYCPWGARVGNGPVWVAFLTDEDFPSPPDPSNMGVGERRSVVKVTRTLENFQTWRRAAVAIFGPKDRVAKAGANSGGGGAVVPRSYVPGLFERSPNDVILTVDTLDGKGIMLQATKPFFGSF